MRRAKISENTIEIEKIIPEARIKLRYNRLFIEQQIKEINAQKKAYDDSRDAEIAECEAIIIEMDKLGIL